MVAAPSAASSTGSDSASDTSSYAHIVIQDDNHRGCIQRDYVLLDSCSMIKQFANGHYLRNIRPATEPVTVFCNAGSTTSTKMGDFGSIPVYYNEHGIANVLSLHGVAKIHHVTYNSWDRGGVFQVHTTSGVVEFASSSKGLHYLDLTASNAPVEHMLVTTLADNFEGHTKRNIELASRAQRLQGMVGHPSSRNFEGMVREKLIANCPVDVTDVHRAHTIFGPDLAGLRGTMVRRRPLHVTTDYVDIPSSFLDAHWLVTLTADVLFMNGLPFLITHSCSINLVTTEFLSPCTAANLAKLLQRVITVYAAAGLKVQIVLMLSSTLPPRTSTSPRLNGAFAHSRNACAPH